MKATFIVFVALVVAVGCQTQQTQQTSNGKVVTPGEAANKLFVESTLQMAEAVSKDDKGDIDGAVAGYGKVLVKVRKIVSDYPESDMAVKFVSGEALFAGKSLEEIEERLKWLKAKQSGMIEFTIEFPSLNISGQHEKVTKADIAKVIESRLLHAGVKYLMGKSETENRIVIQIYGKSTRKHAEIRRVIERVGMIEFRLGSQLTHEEFTAKVASLGTQEKISEEVAAKKILSDLRVRVLEQKIDDNDGGFFFTKVMVENEIQLGGQYISRASAASDSLTGSPVINVRLNEDGAKIFGKVTGENIGRRLAVVLVTKNAAGNIQEELITAPSIQSRISSRFEISGIDTHAEAREIANMLENPFPLSIPVKVIEMRDR